MEKRDRGDVTPGPLKVERPEMSGRSAGLTDLSPPIRRAVLCGKFCRSEKARVMVPFNRILLCYDATPEGRRALRCGAALARQLQAETHLLSILDFSWWSGGYDMLSTMKFDIDEEAAKEILRDGIEKLSGWGVTATGHFVVGSAVEEITRLANALRVDLIVIGHRPEGLFARWWSGDDHALLLNRVSCGVLFEVSE